MNEQEARSKQLNELGLTYRENCNAYLDQYGDITVKNEILSSEEEDWIQVLSNIETQLEYRYKEYQMTHQRNEYGFFEAYSLTDCDAVMIYAKTLDDLKTDIDELEY